jgi:hypothetical protein
VATKLEVSRTLKTLRAANGMSPEAFAALLSSRLADVIVPPIQLLKWEAGQGLSPLWRRRLVPVLKALKEDLRTDEGPGS